MFCVGRNVYTHTLLESTISDTHQNMLRLDILYIHLALYSERPLALVCFNFLCC